MHKAYKPGEAPEHYNFEEYCPHCNNEIPIVIDDAVFRYKMTCPVCGEKLMLCTLCHWDNSDAGLPDRCDWSYEHGCCREREE